MTDAALWCGLALLALLALLAAPQPGPEPAPAAARGLQELQLMFWAPCESSARRVRARARWPGSLRVVEHPGAGPALAAHGLLDLAPRWDELALAAARTEALASHAVPGCRPCELWTSRCRAAAALPLLRGAPTLRCPDPRLLLADGRRLARLAPLLSEAPGAPALLARAARAEGLSVLALTSLLAPDPRGLELEDADEKDLAAEAARARAAGAAWNFDVRGRSLEARK